VARQERQGGDFKGPSADFHDRLEGRAGVRGGRIDGRVRVVVDRGPRLAERKDAEVEDLFFSFFLCGGCFDGSFGLRRVS